MLRGIQLSADKLHQINLVNLDRARNPIQAVRPLEPSPIVGDFSLGEMEDMEYEFLGEEIF